MSTGRKTCDISIIIPTCDEEDTIAAAVNAVAGLAGVEVVVADGGSTDRTVPLARAAGARVTASERGRGSQQNAGAAAARGRVLLFLHADTRLPDCFQQSVLAILRLPGVVAGAFPLGIAARGRGFRLIEWGVNLRASLWQLPYGDQAIFLGAGQFRSMAGFREIPLLEDVDLVLRLRRLGRIELAPVPVLTSARRWQRLGLLRTTLINFLILLCFFAGVSPRRLALWYGKNRQGNGRPFWE